MMHAKKNYSVVTVLVAFLALGLPAMAEYTVVQFGTEEDLNGSLNDLRGVRSEASSEDLGIPPDGPRTVEAWAYVLEDSLGGTDQFIFYTGQGYAARAFSYRIVTSGELRAYTAGSNPPDFPIPGNRWIHVALVYDETDVICYVDGVEMARATDDLDTRINAGPFTVGARPEEISDARALFGYVDEFRVWNVARTQEEIQADMHESLVGDEEGLALYFPFLEGEGDTTLDATLNGHDGIMNDATWVTIQSAPDLTGLTLGQAADELAALGLTVGEIETEGEGDVIVGHNPPPGGRFIDGQNIVVELGEPDITVIVPEVVFDGEWWSLEDVEAALVAAGLTVGTISQVYSDDVPEGLVMGQDPAAGSEIPEGSAVNLTVSRGPAPTDMPLNGLAVLLMVLAVMAAALGSKTLLQRAK